jgi:hypothetical protein
MLSRNGIAFKDKWRVLEMDFKHIFDYNIAYHGTLRFSTSRKSDIESSTHS